MKKKIILSLIIILAIIAIIITLIVVLKRENKVIFYKAIDAFEPIHTFRHTNIYNNGKIEYQHYNGKNTYKKTKKLSKEDLNKLKECISKIETEKLEKVKNGGNTIFDLSYYLRINLNKEISLSGYTSEGIQELTELVNSFEQKYLKED